MGFIKEVKNQQNLLAYEDYLEAEVHSLNNKLFNLNVTEEMYNVLHSAVTEVLSKPMSAHIMLNKLKEALDQVNSGHFNKEGAA